MPSHRFKVAVAVMSLLTVATYVAEPYVGAGTANFEKPASDFSLTTVDGSVFSLAQQGTATPVILDFMATWCIPCRQQLVELKALRAEYGPAEVVMISVDEEYGADPAAVRAFRLTYANISGSIESEGWYFALDTVEEHVGLAYGATALPTLVLIDRSGNIAKTWFGAVSAPVLRGAIEGLLAAPT